MNKFHQLLTALLLSAIPLAGCGRKPAPEPPPPPPAAAPVQLEEPAAPPPPGDPNEAPPPSDGLTPASNLDPMDYSNASGLTLMVHQYLETNKRMPKDLNDLVAAKLLLKVPKAPPGTKYVIDQNKKQVVIVRQ